METLRIAILTETLPPDSLKLQPWRYLGELARALQDAGHEASALTTEAGVPTWNGVRVDRHPDAIDFRSARRLHRLVETRGYDAGIVRLTAGLFFPLHREPGSPPSKGRLLGIVRRAPGGIVPRRAPSFRPFFPRSQGRGPRIPTVRGLRTRSSARHLLGASRGHSGDPRRGPASERPSTGPSDAGRPAPA